MNSPLKILLLEDNDNDVTLVEEHLNQLQLPYTLTHVRDREDFFSELEHTIPDMVLCDYNLPGYDGFAAYKYLKQKGINVPFILITGTLTDDIAAEITHAGIDDYLLKDRLSRLPMAIRKNLEFRAKTLKYKTSAQMLEKKYKLIAENSTDIISVHDVMGTYTYVTPSCLAILGYTPEEMMGTSGYDYFHPEDLALGKEMHTELLTKKQKLSFTVRVKKKDGTYIWVESLTQPIYDPYTDNMTEVVVVSRDVTERVNAQEKLKFTEQLLSEAQFLAKVGNWNMNLKTGELFWSDGLKNIHGTHPDYVPVIEDTVSMVHRADRDEFMKRINNIQQTGGSLEMDYRIVRADDKSVRILHATINALKDRTGNLVRMYGISQDVTELKTVQNELESALKELEQRVNERTKDLSVTNETLRGEIRERIRMGQELEEKNKDIMDSILYAERLQSALIPDVRILKKNFDRFFVFNRQKNIVGGDFYWFHKNRQNYMIACADCTGHGVPGAFMSIIGIDLLNKMIVDQQWKFPTLVLELLDDGINSILGGEKAASIDDGMDMSFCVINKVDKKIQFAGAMNPIVIVSDGEVKTYEASRFGLGAYMNLSKKLFDTQEIDYKEGDMLYMFTDGFQDQFGGERDKKFTPNQLKKLFARIYQLPGDEQKDFLEKVFDDWKGNNEQTDDVMVLGIGL